MNIYWHSCQGTIRGLLFPVGGCFVASILVISAVSAGDNTGSQGSWLHLPALLLVAAGLAAALEHWPLMSRERPGYAWLQRIENRPLHGCLAAALGSMTALGLALAATGWAFTLLLSLTNTAPATLASRVLFEEHTGLKILSAAQPVLRFKTQQTTPVDRLVIRPTPILLSHNDAAISISIHADGKPLHQGFLSNFGDRIELTLTPPRPITTIELRQQPQSSGAMFLPQEDIEGLASSSIPTWLNGLLAGLSYLLPAALSLAIMILGHRRLALPVNFAAGLVVMLVATLTGLTPNSQAIAAFSQGHWLGTEPLGESTGLTLAATISILAVAWLAGKIHRSQ